MQLISVSQELKVNKIFDSNADKIDRTGDTQDFIL